MLVLYQLFGSHISSVFAWFEARWSMFIYYLYSLVNASNISVFIQLICKSYIEFQNYRLNIHKTSI